jgi:hypothetical protein
MQAIMRSQTTTTEESIVVAAAEEREPWTLPGSIFKPRVKEADARAFYDGGAVSAGNAQQCSLGLVHAGPLLDKHGCRLIAELYCAVSPDSGVAQLCCNRRQPAYFGTLLNSHGACASADIGQDV